MENIKSHRQVLKNKNFKILTSIFYCKETVKYMCCRFVHWLHAEDINFLEVVVVWILN